MESTFFSVSSIFCNCCSKVAKRANWAFVSCDWNQLKNPTPPIPILANLCILSLQREINKSCTTLRRKNICKEIPPISSRTFASLSSRHYQWHDLKSIKRCKNRLKSTSFTTPSPIISHHIPSASSEAFFNLPSSSSKLWSAAWPPNNLPSGKLIWQWKLPIFPGKIASKWWILHCCVSFDGVVSALLRYFFCIPWKLKGEKNDKCANWNLLFFDDTHHKSIKEKERIKSPFPTFWSNIRNCL